MHVVLARLLIVLARLLNRGAVRFVMITLPLLILRALVGKVPVQAESIAIFVALALMSIGIYLTLDLYLLGKNCPSCTVRLRRGTNGCYSCGLTFSD